MEILRVIIIDDEPRSGIVKDYVRAFQDGEICIGPTDSLKNGYKGFLDAGNNVFNDADEAAYYLGEELVRLSREWHSVHGIIIDTMMPLKPEGVLLNSYHVDKNTAGFGLVVHLHTKMLEYNKGENRTERRFNMPICFVTQLPAIETLDPLKAMLDIREIPCFRTKDELWLPESGISVMHTWKQDLADRLPEFTRELKEWITKSRKRKT